MDKGKLTSATPQVVAGVIFRCYRDGILRYRWISDNGRFSAGRNFNASTFFASVDGQRIKKRFRSLANAMKGAIDAGKGPRP